MTNTWANSTNGRAYKVANIPNKGTDRKGKDKLCFYFHPNGTKLSDGERQKLQDGGMKKTWVQAQYLAIDKAAAFQRSIDEKNITKRQATEPISSQ